MSKTDWKRLARELGRRGGKAAARKLSPEQRTERARKAGLARQEKTKKAGAR